MNPVESDRATADPRAEKTRQAIFEAVRQLISDRVASVTVSDIVRTAQISRSSFYAHFGSLDELATAFLRAQFAAIGATEPVGDDHLSGSHAARAGYTRLVAHIVEHYPLYSSVLEVPLTRTAFDDVVEAYSTRLLQSVFTVGYVPESVNPELLTTYVAGGALTSISAWMRGRIDISDDELIEQLVGLLPVWALEPRA
jgi:AcrR family transcriptional regulator